MLYFTIYDFDDYAEVVRLTAETDNKDGEWIGVDLTISLPHELFRTDDEEFRDDLIETYINGRIKELFGRKAKYEKLYKVSY